MTTIKIKTILSYLIMIIFAGCIFSSCNDNDELIEKDTTQTEIVKKKKFEVDFYLKDKDGNLWHIKGTADVSFRNGTAKLDLVLTNTNTGQSYHLEGTVKYSNGKVTNIQEIHLCDEKGNEVDWEKEIPDLMYIIDECLNNLDLEKTVANIQRVHLYDENGSEVNWKDEIPDLEYIINECLNRLDI